MTTTVPMQNKAVDKQSVRALLDGLDEAKKRYEEAKTEEREASSKATSSRNYLNQVQKKIDVWYAEQKKEAPHDTDWGSKSSRDMEEG